MQIQCEYEVRLLSFSYGFKIHAKYKIPNKLFKLSLDYSVYINTDEENHTNWYSYAQAETILTKESEMIKIMKHMFIQTKEYRDLMQEPSDSDKLTKLLSEKCYTKHKGVTIEF